MKEIDFTELKALIQECKKDEGAAKSGVESEMLKGFAEWFGVPLPPSYLEFVKELDGGEYSFARMIKITQPSDRVSEFTETFNQFEQMSSDAKKKLLIPFADDWGGNYYCFDRRKMKDGEYPVVQIDHEVYPDEKPDFIAENFFEFMKMKVEDGSEAE